MSSNKQARHESRVVAVRVLFSYLAREEKVSIKETFQHVIEVDEKESDDFAESLIQSAIDNFAKIKLIIKAFAPEFAFEKIAPINRSILILGLTELKYFDTPPIVVINEYIEIAKEFGEEKSAGFVNGVLDAFRKGIGKSRLDNEDEDA